MDTTSGIVHGYSDSVQRGSRLPLFEMVSPLKLVICRLISITSTGSGVSYKMRKIRDLNSYRTVQLGNHYHKIHGGRLEQNVLEEFEADHVVGSRIRCKILKNHFESDHFEGTIPVP
jgi:hypothetical protein